MADSEDAETRGLIVDDGLLLRWDCGECRLPLGPA